MSIEVEVRSFISKEKYHELLTFFTANAKRVNEDEQETHYFDGKADVRIQKNKQYAKLWMKEGKMHDDARKEVEIKVPKEDFDKFVAVFAALGFKTTVKWFRTRHTFEWGEVSVMVDYNKGYGYILEMEKMATESEKEGALALLKSKMAQVGVAITPKDEFAKAYDHYMKNWEQLTK